jgi:hypothetical protein
LAQLQTVSHDELKAILKNANKARLSLLIFGHPGIGKSQLVQEYANEVKLPLVDVRASYLDPTDISGIPFANKEDKVAEFYRPKFIPTDNAILFLDEINQAAPLVQSALFQLILDRRIRDIKLSDTVQIVAAGNFSEDSNLVYELPLPLLTRFMRVELQNPTLEAWTSWAKEHGIDERIIAFLSWKPDMLYSPKKELLPRTWEFASRSMLVAVDRSATLTKDLLEDLRPIIGSTLGQGPGYEFIEFIKLALTIKSDVLFWEGSVAKKWKELDAPGKYALTGAITAIVNELRPKEKKDTKSIKAANLMLDILENIDAEFGVLFIQLLNSSFLTEYLITQDKDQRLSTKYFKLVNKLRE